jgi:hypothetical protein
MIAASMPRKLQAIGRYAPQRDLVTLSQPVKSTGSARLSEEFRIAAQVSGGSAQDQF